MAKNAQEDYDFYNGRQWNEQDLAVLREQNRPVMTFNRIAPLVNAVIGTERNNKRQVQFIPRQEGLPLQTRFSPEQPNGFVMKLMGSTKILMPFKMLSFAEWGGPIPGLIMKKIRKENPSLQDWIQ